MALAVWAARCATLPPGDGTLHIIAVVRFSIAVTFAMMAAVVMVVVVAVPVVVIARHRILLLATLSSVRANFTRLTMVVILAITRSLAGKGDLPVVRGLVPNDDRCRRGLLEDDLLLRGALSNNDGSGGLCGLVVLGLFAPALNIGTSGNIAVVAAFFNTAFYTDFAAIPVLDPLLDAHLGLVLVVPV
jgi:hypothetical protein